MGESRIADEFRNNDAKAKRPFWREERHNMQKSQFKHTHVCWICGNAVDLETCKTDERGMAVHENCYVMKVVLANESKLGWCEKPHMAAWG
jgi:hypothetical protein